MKMRKRIAMLLAFVMAFAMTVTFTGCGGSSDEGEQGAFVEDPDVQAFMECVDVDYSEALIKELQKFGTNDYYGFRMGAAQNEASDVIAQKMEEIGLEDVEKDEITVDLFDFKNAELTYTKANGKEKTIEMAMFQTTYQATDEDVEIVYVGEGTAADYEDVDVSGKICLLDINQVDNWWICWPAYQAKVKGAKAIIAVNTEGYCSYSEDTVGSQDITGPDDAPAFTISVAQAKPLKRAIKKNGGSINAKLTADAVVSRDQTAYNVSGVIKGETDETIYLMSHYDAYFRAFSDDTAGLACMLSIAKAMNESGYTPQRTIKFIAHANEEWGVSDSRYDWAAGCEKEMEKHGEEWLDGAYMAINLDGGFVSGQSTGINVSTQYELAKWEKDIANKVPCGVLEGKTKVTCPAWTWTDAICYTEHGIPVMDPEMDGEDYTGTYHSTADTEEGNDYSRDVYESCHKLFGGITILMDKTGNKVYRYGKLFKAMKNSVNADLAENYDELMAAYDEAIAASQAYTAKCEAMADTYDYEFNKDANQLFKQVNDDFFKIDWNVDYVFQYSDWQRNIEYLQSAIDSLKEGDVQTALDEYLWGVDISWYAYYFDEETYDYFVNQAIGPNARNSWGGYALKSEAGLWPVINELLPLYDEENPDVSDQIDELEKVLEAQKAEYNKAIARDIKSLKAVTKKLNKLAK